MALEAEQTKKAKLPLTIMTTVDLARLERELAALDEFGFQSSIREAGRQPALPRTSRGLEEIANQNSLNLLVEADRAALKRQLSEYRQNAPVIHMSFAADPSPTFLTKLVTWLREEIHPSLLISIGLQPSIAAGCIIRTKNKYFDFSLRKYLDQNTKLLTEALKEIEA